MTSFRDWVVETSSTTGTSAYALSGSAPAGTSYFTFRQRFANGDDEIVYWVTNSDATKWEKNRFGTLTYGSPDQLSRNVVESTGGDAPISWTAGDAPLLVYVVPDAEAQEFAITMGLGAARPDILKNGLWADEDGVSAGVDEINYFDGTSDIPVAEVDTATHDIVITAKTLAFHNVAIQTFTATGTYTPNTKMVSCIIECWGGGGGGGGSANTASSIGASASGGGAGGYSLKVASAADIGASQAVTIGAAGTGASAGNNNGGAGGETSVGTLCIAKGGAGGGGNNGANIANGAAGGSTTGAVGDVRTFGTAGGSTTTGSGSPSISGFGGASSRGGNGPSVVSISAAGGVSAAANSGSGGSGGSSFNAQGAAGGGNGGSGFVKIIEFLKG